MKVAHLLKNDDDKHGVYCIAGHVDKSKFLSKVNTESKKNFSLNSVVNGYAVRIGDDINFFLHNDIIDGLKTTYIEYYPMQDDRLDVEKVWLCDSGGGDESGVTWIDRNIINHPDVICILDDPSLNNGEPCTEMENGVVKKEDCAYWKQYKISRRIAERRKGDR